MHAHGTHRTSSMALSSTRIVRIVVFLKEAAVQLDNARLVAKNAAGRRTEASAAALLRGIVAEIARLELMRQSRP
jgi:hypothetical protein